MLDKEKPYGSMTPVKIYSLVDAARGSFNVGALALGVSGQINEESSLYTLITVEGFCAAVSLMTLAHEAYLACSDQYGFSSGRSIYLCFRLMVILTSIFGLSLIASDVSGNRTGGIAITAGALLVALGIFGSRVPSSFKEKTYINKAHKAARAAAELEEAPSDDEGDHSDTDLKQTASPV